MREKVIVIILAALYSILIFLVADSSLGFNPIMVTKKINNAFFSVLPQGWGFFTRNPREPLVDIYEITLNGPQKVTIPNASLKYIYGFNRGMRFTSSQVGYLVGMLQENNWREFKNLKKAQTNVSSFIQLRNNFSPPLLCGKFIMVKTERIPWAWAKHRNTVNMPVLAVGILADCDEE